MHDIKDIVRRPDHYKIKLAMRGIAPSVVVEAITLNAERIRIAQEVEQLQAVINKLGDEIGVARAKGLSCDEAIRYATVLKSFMPMAKEGNLGDFIERCKETL